MSTAYTYFPQTENNGIQYRVFDITAIWDPLTFCLPIYTQVRRSYDVSITPESYYSPAFIGVAMHWQNPVGTWARSLKNGAAVSSNGKYYVGEGVNEWDNFTYPPEALITYNPIAGETIEEYSRIFVSPTDNTLVNAGFHWKYKTIQHLDTWGAYADCWRTALYEIDNQHVYNYVFAKDAGMIDFWHGSLAADNSVIGVRYYAAPL